MKNGSRQIMVVAGEASGDKHAAKVVRELLRLRPEWTFFGSAGPEMRAQGVDAVVEADGLSIVGLAEIGRALPMFMKAMRDLTVAAERRKPAVAVLVDFPDFNLKLSWRLKKRGVKVVYYISPQLWAWRKYRISTIRKYVDLLITILPFEKDWYAAHGVDHVEYVGNPLANEVAATRNRETFCRDHGLDPARPIVALLPGSRQKEIARILPVMLAGAGRLHSERKSTQFVLALASDRHLKSVTNAVRRSATNVTIVCRETYDALAASDAAAVTSGTATLEAGIIGTPMVIVYKTSAVNYKLLEPMIDVPHYGLINLIARERLATELIQQDLTPEKLSRELLRLLDPENNADMRRRLATVAAKLGKGGASKRAAALILDLVDRSDL
ncbi:MAG TPA: lipid-A-disaccharide synthase [Pyrinomonadaceae bacterium]|nr:lipid-A-disaccharide synthase [Pyrinomonadaceae bacterium]